MPQTNALPMRPRLAATLALIPMVIFVWWVVFYETIRIGWRGGAGSASAWSVLSTAFLIYPGPFWLYYVLVIAIWWRTVRWTGRRRAGVAAATVSVLAASIGCGYWALTGYVDEDFFLSGCLALNLVFGPAILVFVAWLCYPNRGETSDDTLRCPGCAYDLRGQRECRCPECGREFSIGELAPRAEE